MKAIHAVTQVPFLDLRAQYTSIKDEIDTAIARVIDASAFIGGPFVKTFEESFASYCGVDHCVGVANGTDALFIALRALNVSAGDEVIVPANSFIATSEAVTMAGAKVVFCDIDPNTYNIDVDQIEAKITSRTKAIIPVHLYGQPADMDPIRSLGRKYGLKIVGDAAQAHGAYYKGQPIAKLADITCFSFYPGKNLGAYGDGGALVTDDAAYATLARMIANHGRIQKYDHEFEGVNSRLDGLQAAVLGVKLRYLDKWIESRREIASRYNVALAGLGVGTPKELADIRAVYHLYVVRVPATKRTQLQRDLAAKGVGTGVHYPIALPYLNAYRSMGHSERDFPESFRAAAEVLSLPIYAELGLEQAWYVAEQFAASL